MKMKDYNNEFNSLQLAYLARVWAEKKLYRKTVALLTVLFILGITVCICGYVFFIRNIPLLFATILIVGMAGALIWVRLGDYHKQNLDEIKAAYVSEIEKFIHKTNLEMFSQLGTVHMGEDENSGG